MKTLNEEINQRIEKLFQEFKKLNLQNSNETKDDKKSKRKQLTFDF